jgi:hypothetical protein
MFPDGSGLCDRGEDCPLEYLRERDTAAYKAGHVGSHPPTWLTDFD